MNKPKKRENNLFKFNKQDEKDLHELKYIIEYG